MSEGSGCFASWGVGLSRDGKGLREGGGVSGVGGGEGRGRLAHARGKAACSP